MIERLLLDGIDAEAAGPPVGGEHDPAVLASAHEAETALALLQLAEARAEIALDAAVFERVPVFRGNRQAGNGYIGHCRNSHPRQRRDSPVKFLTPCSSPPPSPGHAAPGSSARR